MVTKGKDYLYRDSSKPVRQHTTGGEEKFIKDAKIQVLINKLVEVSHGLEELGASEELTAAVCDVSDLIDKIENL